MAPLIYFGDTPYRSGISTADADDPASWLDTGVFDPNAKSEKEARKMMMLKKLEKKKRATIVHSEHRTASLRLLKTDKEEHDRLVHNELHTTQEIRTAASHHTHGHKMLAELMLNDPTLNELSGGHQLKHNLSPATSPVKKKQSRPYTPNEAIGIPTSNYQSDRWVASVSIKPAHKKNSTVRLGFSGHSPEAKKGRTELKRCEAIDSYDTKRLLGTPVIVPEGVLKEQRASALFRSIGEFPHRDRVPLSEKISVGKELSRKPDTLKTTRAGGFTWLATNPDMPYKPNNVLDSSYIKSELAWLKSSAFIKGNDKRPRTKGLISSELSKMTRPTILDFVPLVNRKEYRDNILGGGVPSNKMKEGNPNSVRNRSIQLSRFRELDRGDLDTIHSGDGDSVTGSLQSLSQDVEGEGSAVLGWESGRKGSVGSLERSQSMKSLQQNDQPETHQQHRTALNAGSPQHCQHNHRQSWIIKNNHSRPLTSVGLTGRRMANIEVKAPGGGTFETAERPITITKRLRENILRSRGVVATIDL